MKTSPGSAHGSVILLFPSVHYLAFLFHSINMFFKNLNVNAKPGGGEKMSNIHASLRRHDVSVEEFDPSNLICFKCEMILYSLIIRLHVVGS